MQHLEQWRAIPGFPLYQVSDRGNVRSKAYAPRRGALNWRPLANRRRNGAGYPSVAFRLEGRTYQKVIHRLVCEAFHGPAPAGRELVRHLDDDPTNNRAENLAWGTQAENMADRLRNRAFAIRE